MRLPDSVSCALPTAAQQLPCGAFWDTSTVATVPCLPRPRRHLLYLFACCLCARQDVALREKIFSSRCWVQSTSQRVRELRPCRSAIRKHACMRTAGEWVGTQIPKSAGFFFLLWECEFLITPCDSDAPLFTHYTVRNTDLFTLLIL